MHILNPLYNQYQIKFSDFRLTNDQFDHPSQLHGIMHTYRVMVHTLKLGLLTGNIKEARNSFFAAYIHDMARTHDGYCTRHGADAANNILPAYHDLFHENGATGEDILVIGKVVTLHSIGRELSRVDADWLSVALLKDADALDRIRLGEDDLNTAYLRLAETQSLIEYGKQLFSLSQSCKPNDFAGMLNLSDEI